MSYQVDRFNGTFLTSVADGTIDTTTDIRLVGKNYAGYGEVQNENFLHLMEHFANTTPPPKVITGQVWYDSANKKLKFYDGSRFKVAGGAEVGASAPSGLQAGDFWWDTSAKQLYTFNGTDYTLIGPVSSPDLGTSTIQAANVKGTIETGVGPHSILKVIVDDKVIGIFSKDEEFTLDGAQNPIDDFTVIKKGFTLVKTNASTGVSTDNYIIWGTAQNANSLGGFTASDYVRKGDISFTNEVAFKDPGFTVGDGNDLRVRVENGDEVVVENRLGNPITFRITVTDILDERDVAIIRSDGVIPGNNNEYTLGTATLRWNNVYATTLTGNVIGNVTGNTTGTHKGNLLASDDTVMINASTKVIGYEGATLYGTLNGSVTGSASISTNSSKLNDLDPSVNVPGSSVATIPVRDSTGNIYANQFIGTTDKADKIFIDRTNAVSDPAWDEGTKSTKYRTARITATAYSIAARDSSGDITANLFKGTATAARYADLAEKYLPDAEYDIGTVMVVGGEKEVTASSWGQRAIGVISENPAFMMNKDLEGGVYVALKGRVPVKISGRVRKGDRLIAGNDGRAVAGVPHSNDVFAIALADSENDTVEAIIL